MGRSGINEVGASGTLEGINWELSDLFGGDCWGYFTTSLCMAFCLLPSDWGWSMLRFAVQFGLPCWGASSTAAKVLIGHGPLLHSRGDCSGVFGGWGVGDFFQLQEG